MFGIGPGELAVIAVLFLVIFGPDKVPQMARDIGKFTNEARRAIEDFREDITSVGDEDKDDADEEDDDTYDQQSSTDDEDENEEDDAVERDL